MTESTPNSVPNPSGGENPYAPPSFPQSGPPAPQSPGFRPEGRKVPAGNGVAWLSSGWGFFKEAPGMWILFTIILIGLSLGLSVVPLGQIAMSLISPVLLAGIMLGCAALKQGEPLELSHLFGGFSAKAGPLLTLGLLYLVGTIAILLIVFVVALVGFGVPNLPDLLSGEPVDVLAGAGGLIAGFLVAVLVFLLLLIPLAMAFWFAPALVVFHDIEPLAALRSSFKVCLANFAAFFLYGLLGLVLAVVASIPFLLGWLVLSPVILGSIYAGYRDIYVDR